MVNLLAQPILAARDLEGWTNILFIVGLAAFYIIGSIIKIKTSKKKEQEQPGRKPPEPTPVGGPPRPLQKTPYQQARRPVGPTPKSQPRPQVAKPQAQPPRRKITRPQPVGRKLPAKKAEQAIGLEAIEPLEALKLSPRYLSEILSDYDDPEKLRRAILHYEILGKPMALRDPSGHIIGL